MAKKKKKSVKRDINKIKNEIVRRTTEININRTDSDRTRRKTEIFKFQKKFKEKKNLKNRSTSINENLKNKSFLKATNSFMRKMKNNKNMIDSIEMKKIVPKINDFYLITGGTCESSLNLQFLKKKNFELHFTKKCMKLKNVKNHGSFVINNKIYIFGGKQRKNINSKIIEFDYNKEKFKECSFCLLKPKYDFAFVKISKWKILIFGGKDKKGNPLNEIELLDFKTGKTKIIGYLKNNRYAFSAIIKPEQNNLSNLSQQINIFEKGNEKNPRYDNKKEGYNIYSSYKPKLALNNQQSCYTPFNNQKTEQSFISSQNRDKSPSRREEENLLIYLIGGKKTKKIFYKTIDIFCLKKLKVIDSFKMECSKSRICISSNENKVYIFGGKNHKDILKNIGVIENNKYRLIAFMSKERSHFSGVWRGSEFVYFGGKCGNKIVKDWEVFDKESYETKVFTNPIGKRLYNFNIIPFSNKN